MKKSSLLSLLTAASIALTTAGTYAAWDTLKAETTSTVTFRNPVTIEVNPTYTLNDTKELGTPSVSGTVDFTVKGKEVADTLTFTPSVTGYDGADANHFDFTITDKSGDSSVSGFVDNDLESTSYNVTVTPKEEYKDKIAGKELSIKLTATLSKSK